MCLFFLDKQINARLDVRQIDINKEQTFTNQHGMFLITFCRVDDVWLFDFVVFRRAN